LPYTLEGFTEVVRDRFKIAMAAAANTGCNCGITKSEVMILVKENAPPPGTRSRLSAAAGITVGVSLLVPDVQAGSVLVKSGVLTKDAMNKELAKQGLDPIDKITSGPMLLSSASNGNNSSTVSSGGQPPADPSPNSGIAVGVVVGVVVGVIALVVIAVVAFLRFRHNKAKAAREVARQQAVAAAFAAQGAPPAGAPSQSVTFKSVETESNVQASLGFAGSTSPPGISSGEDLPAGDEEMTLEELLAAMPLEAEEEPSEDTSGSKFSAKRLLLGNPQDSDLRLLLGLDDHEVFGFSMLDPFSAMEAEWNEHGTEEDKANWRYVVEGIAGDPEWIPEHIKALGHVLDTGREGWTLEHFLESQASKKAGLKKEHVIALRLYSSSSFGLFNKGMREKTTPHPIRVSVYMLNDALKKLRKVAATENPSEYNKVKILYRGMKDMKVDFAEFARTGGTEVSAANTLL
jgi:hypothetical protein